MASKKWFEIGSIRKGDKGLYIKIHADKDRNGKFDFTALKELARAIENAGEKGITLQIEKPENEIRRLAELGFIDEDKVESRIESIPAWKKYIIKLPPQD